MLLITVVVALTTVYVYAMAVTSARVRAREAAGGEDLFFVLSYPRSTRSG